MINGSLKARTAAEAGFAFRITQAPYRFDQGVLGHLRRVQPHPLGGLQCLPVDVEAGRSLASHLAACPHMILCASRYLMPSKGKAEVVAYALRLKA